MRTVKFTSVFAALFMAAFTAFATNGVNETYTADVKKSEIKWHGKKVTGEHNGTIQLQDGDIMVENGKLTGGKFAINMGTISNDDITDADSKAKLEGHLKSDDFFGVEKHPKATFVITSVTPKSGAEYTVKGDITIKGKTQSIEFPATVAVKGKEVHANAKIVVDRSKFDVRYGSGSFFDGLGDKMIYDDFTLDISLVATK
ncbi:MAG: YceI family protein [Cyclobacteriaceae bacterium]